MEEKKETRGRKPFSLNIKGSLDDVLKASSRQSIEFTIEVGDTVNLVSGEIVKLIEIVNNKRIVVKFKDGTKEEMDVTNLKVAE